MKTFWQYTSVRVIVPALVSLPFVVMFILYPVPDYVFLLFIGSILIRSLLSRYIVRGLKKIVPDIVAEYITDDKDEMNFYNVLWVSAYLCLAGVAYWIRGIVLGRFEEIDMMRVIISSTLVLAGLIITACIKYRKYKRYPIKTSME